MATRRQFIGGALALGTAGPLVGTLTGCEPPGVVPSTRTLSGNVTIAGGFTVAAGEVWSFDPNVSTTVHVRGNVVVAGTLRMRPANPQVVHHLVFDNVDESRFVGGGHQVLATDVGLWVTGDGVLDAVGSRKQAWTRVTGALLAGATTIQVADAAGWRVGDTIVVTPTAPVSTSGFWRRYDERRITGITGTRVTVAALTENHPSVLDQRGRTHTAEVLNLSRNVRITGTEGGRAHVMMLMTRKPQVVENVELAHLGPRQGSFGRYALHHHMAGNASAGTRYTGVVAHHIGSHAFVPHSSHGVTFDRCVAHDTWDDAFWWDPVPGNTTPGDATNRVWWKDCVASKTQYSPASRAYRLSAFLLMRDDNRQSVLNKLTGCVAVGTEANTEEVDDPAFGDSAGFGWPEEVQATEGVWEFHDNVAHNCRGSGIFTWQNTPLPHDVGATVVYNTPVGLNHGAYLNRYHYHDHVYTGVRQGVRLHALSDIANPPLRFENFDIQVAGGAAAVWITKHSLRGQPPVFRRCRFRGAGTASVVDDAGNDGGAVPTRASFADCDWQPGVPHVTVRRGPGGTDITEVAGGTVEARHGG